METLLSVMRQHLTDHGFRPEKKGQSLRAYFDGDNGVWFLVVTANEDDRWLICRSILPVAVPAPQRKTVAAFLTRYNTDLILGNFEIDMADGEVAFKTSLRLTADELTDAMIKDLLCSNFGTFDHVLPGLLAIIHGKRGLRKALQIIGHPIEEPAPAAAEATSEAPLPDDGTTEA